MRGRKMILATTAACAGLVAGCGQRAPEAPAVDLAAEAQAVRDRSAEWLALAQSKDAAGIVNGMYTENAVTLFDGDISHGTAEIMARMEADNARSPNATIAWSTTDVQLASSGDLAYELGAWNYDPDGDGVAAATSGEFVTVWTKVDGIWRAAVDAGTSPKAAEAAAPAGG